MPSVRALRWCLGVLLVALILIREIEEGHAVHIVLILVSVACLGTVAFFYQDRPKLGLICAAVSLASFLTIASVHLFVSGWDGRWLGWLSLVVVVLIGVFVVRRHARHRRHP
jgi:CHASE2 domain-containing sensor protein